MRRIEGVAYARAGLLGNPSCMYQGKTISFVIRNFKATVKIEQAENFEIVRGSAEKLTFPSFIDMVREIDKYGCYDGIRLLRSAIKKFTDYWPGLFDIQNTDYPLKFKISYHTNIPRQAGLAGSSAIIIALLRALMSWFDVEAQPAVLAELALAAEIEELGIAAGQSDRVVQAYEGVLYMDFMPPITAKSYIRIEKELLPALFIAWDPNRGQCSGKIHNDFWKRWHLGDPVARNVINEFKQLADKGLECLKKRDLICFQQLVNKNFDTRASQWKINPRDFEMVAIGRKKGAAVKFCGSGGSVVGVIPDNSNFPLIEESYRANGFMIIRPEI